MSSPTGHGDGERQPRQRAGLHVRRPDDGHQPEEDEDEDLAERRGSRRGSGPPV